MRRGPVFGLVAVAAVVGAVAWWGTTREESTSAEKGGPTFVISPVERRTLVDEVTVRGQVRRDELQRITSPIEGQVSALLVEPGDTIEAGDTIMALSGRAAVAVPGDFSFFRPLDVGSEGPDVLQLETILAADGYDVGTVDDLFTEATRTGLERWQGDRGYGGATPESTESLTIGLLSSADYDVGATNTVAFLIEPRSDQPSAVPATLGPTGFRRVVPTAPGHDRGASAAFTARSDATAQSVSTTLAPATTVPVSVAATTTTIEVPVPAIDVVVDPATVVEGQVAVFTFRSDRPMPTDTVIDYVVGGDATAGDDFDETGLTGSFVMAAGRSTFDLRVATTADRIIESDEAVVITVGNGINVNPDERYRPGPLKEARLTITSPADEVATVSVRNDQGAITEGSTAQFVFESTQERNEPTTLRFRVSGSASEGADFSPVEREIELPAGQTEVTLAVATLVDRRVEQDEYLVVTLDGSSDYRVFGAPADVVIESSDVPELTVQGGGAVGEGDAMTFTIVADQAPIVDTSVNYSFGGSATPGQDYETLTGTVVLPAGSKSVTVPIVTIDDDVIFRPGDMIVAEWPARVGTVSVDEGEFILLGAEVLTLTEPDFTITLRLTPTERSNLTIGLEAEVELQASGQDAVPGVIVELDDTATIDQAGTETYEGVIETTGTLDAVDGASVNVDVVRERRTDVITVPVASVLQDGQGNDVVRIVLDDGTTRQVPVEIGLSEGAFVEVRSGLDGDELVLVET